MKNTKGGKPFDSKHSGQPLIVVSNLSHSFQIPSGNVEVLKDINLEVGAGDFTIIYGPSGSGKTTLLNIIAGLQKPVSGSVTVRNRDIYGYGPDELAFFRSQELGLVYQSNYWVKSLSVLNNVALPLFVSGHEIHEANQKAMDALRRIGMDKFAHYRPTVLSGGQQQRVSMARALVANPSIILADEPTGNLDTANGQIVIELLKQVQKDLGITVILITHNLDYLSYSNHNIHLIDGRILKPGSEKLPASAGVSP